MASKKKMLWNIIFMAVIFGITVYLVFRGKDVGEIIAVASHAKPGYLLIALVCLITFIIGESTVIYYMMKTLGADIRMSHCALYSFVGFFFSCITPSATGGQPMQIYYMRKDKLPVPVTTLVLMIVTITYKAVLVIIGVAVFLFCRSFLEGYLGDLMWVFYVGVLMNVFCVSGMLVLVFAPGLAKWIMHKGLRILEKLHLLKHKESRTEKLEASMNQYHETAAFWATHKRVIFNVLLITIAQRFFHFTITYWVYKALGLSGYGFITITLLQSVISVSVDMLPLPGGMGISETLYLAMFEPVFGSLLLPSMLLSRGISYYGEMLVSALMTCVAHVVIKDQNEVEAKE
ncbi:MAG: flippase-like domain-containing protein [Blautia sp.]|nr:flippase-like domain-containing protein [Blautia sp.]